MTIHSPLDDAYAAYLNAHRAYLSGQKPDEATWSAVLDAADNLRRHLPPPHPDPDRADLDTDDEQRIIRVWLARPHHPPLDILAHTHTHNPDDLSLDLHDPHGHTIAHFDTSHLIGWADLAHLR